MNRWVILWEVAAFLALFTCMVMIPALKNPVSGIHNYPPEIQEANFRDHPRIETAPRSGRTVLIKSADSLLFSAMLTGGALLAGADSLHRRLAELYAQVELQTVESMACFCCRKGVEP